MRPMLLRWLWDRLSTSFWFWPTIMTLVGAGLAFGFCAVDTALQGTAYEPSAWVWTGGPEGARMLLGTLAGAVITVESTVFSITIVALTLASNAFGPRLLRNFIRDRGNQLILGTFTATFVYFLLVLRTIRGGEEAAFVPNVSISVALTLTLVDVGVLIYFIHHVATTIQADEVVAIAGHDLERAIAELHTRGDYARDGDGAPEGPSCPLRAPASGYLQAVEEDTMVAALVRCDGVAHLAVRPGDFVIAGSVIAEVWREGPAGELDEEVAAALGRALLIDDRRTPLQDLEFSLHQLVEIASRALSPGINDPFTAMTCVDWLASGLARLAQRPPATGCRRDEAGRLRLLDRPITFRGALCAAFDPLRHIATGLPQVVMRMMEALATVAGFVDAADDRDAIRALAGRLERVGHTWPEEQDRRDLDTRHRQVLLALDRSGEVDRAPAHEVARAS
ncbi:MAG: DUF2254 domain-containing protein [Nannocystaceae bacterium]